mmetsp:Transcript_12546/g.22157  ORF Transcript_12546/g.22157 Transcript_12546/m.22157 type:complete len:83 (+) Transcript_12546:296-544(+)
MALGSKQKANSTVMPTRSGGLRLLKKGSKTTFKTCAGFLERDQSFCSNLLCQPPCNTLRAPHAGPPGQGRKYFRAGLVSHKA